MNLQSTHNILMVRPNNFCFNHQTAINNYYQNNPKKFDDKIKFKALEEFDLLVYKLRSSDINVYLFEDNSLHTPDSLFPNNWVSTHEDGTIYLYPMFAENRRLERSDSIIDSLKNSFYVKEVINRSKYHEELGLFLEGTGSMVLDRINKISYVAISERTNYDLASEWCKIMDYSLIPFHSFQTVNGRKKPIYHTNVMMSIGTDIAIVCLDSIVDESERITVVNSLVSTNKHIINISEKQCNRFAGNVLEVMGQKRYLLMSTNAYESFNDYQLSKISSHNWIIHSPINTIEQIGGGGVRCMMAELFLPDKL